MKTCVSAIGAASEVLCVCRMSQCAACARRDCGMSFILSLYIVSAPMREKFQCSSSSCRYCCLCLYPSLSCIATSQVFLLSGVLLLLSNMRFLHMHYADTCASNLCISLTHPCPRCRNEYGLLLVIFYIQIGLTCIGGFLSFLIILGISSLQCPPSLPGPSPLRLCAVSFPQ